MLAENRKTEAIANSTIAAYEIELKGAVGWTTNAGKSGKRKRQRPRGLWRFILEDLAVLIGCCVFWLPSDQPPVCTGDQPFGLAFRLTSDFHRRSFFRRCLPTQPPTLIGCQILRPAFLSISSFRFRPTLRPNLPVSLQLSPSTNLPAQPSGQPSTCVFDQPSGSAFASTCDSRRLPILRPAFRLTSSLRLRSIVRLNLPVNLSTCVSWSTFQFCLKPNLRLSSAAASSGAAVRFTFDSRLRSTFRPCLRTQPPTLIGCCISGFAFRPISDLRLRPAFQLCLQTQLSTHRLLHPFGAAVQLTFDSRLRSTFRPCLWTQPPTYRLLCSPVLSSG